VLGVDPGSLTTGWGLLGGTASRPRLLDSGVVRLGRSGSFAGRLARLHQELTTVVERLRPGVAAVEAPFHGASARSALRLAHARGVVLAVLAAAGVEVVEYAPAAVKKAVTGNGRADKEQVATMVFRQVGEELAARPHDLSDALAVALCHLSHCGFSAAVQQAETAQSKTGKAR
jgi:crossover junction endodeoxyribonuclease RuvC